MEYYIILLTNMEILYTVVIIQLLPIAIEKHFIVRIIELLLNAISVSQLFNSIYAIVIV